MKSSVAQAFQVGFVSSVLVSSTGAFATPLSLNDYSMTSKLLSVPAHLEVNSAGVSEFDKSAWTLEKQNDGTELYSLKAKPQTAGGAILRNASGELESITVYKASEKKAGSESPLGQTEESGALIFEKGALRAYTSCEDRGEKEIGRVCVTATPDLCHALKASSVRPEELKQTDEYEMKALAVLLTLRGSDHQLDNMAKTGNRLGLKSALQTTKGQLFALAREIAKEAGNAASAVASAAKKRLPASADPKLETENKLAQSVLERSLPRLKQACLDTHFN